jgi:WD40 repeat protein
VELSPPGLESSKKLDEVWQVRFSPDGKRLAACGTDDAVNIWDVERLTFFHQLSEHQKPGIGNLAWSPDSKLLVTCSFDHTAKLWNVEVSRSSTVRVCWMCGVRLTACFSPESA